MHIPPRIHTESLIYPDGSEDHLTMDKLTVVYKCDNGYTCSCCRSEWEDEVVVSIPDILAGYASIESYLLDMNKQAEASYAKYNDGKYAISRAYIVSDVWNKQNNTFVKEN